MSRAVKLAEHDILFEAKVRADLEAVLAGRPRTVVIVWEDEKRVHCLAQPHTRGVIAGVLNRLLETLHLKMTGE